jgi:hypothetical protein
VLIQYANLCSRLVLKPYGRSSKSRDESGQGERVARGDRWSGRKTET